MKGVVEKFEGYSIRQHLPGAEDKIVYDKFHIAKHLGEAVDRVRRAENKLLRDAIPCLLVSVALLGFINLATYEAISSWGVSEAFAEITGTPWNISMFIGCWVIGLVSLCVGLSVISSPFRRATAS